MSENQKFYYARYLGVMGTYHKKILKNFEQSIPYCTKALKILDKLDDEANGCLKFNLISHIYDSYVFLGKTQFAEELLAKMAKLVKHGSIQEADMSLIYSSKSVLCEMQGKYHEALEYVDKIIELFIKNGSHIHDLYFTGTYISRCLVPGCN
ncbi:hypothetical protein [Candidatus Tisiphia endosymbiont of Dioctria rufipes]|uniref:hypothetical protein n=1 Tax=Candidatus Tisiphia endosymbiont of Dioctria rufipes TaxID=3066255 RepID=UPI00312C96D9